MFCGRLNEASNRKGGTDKMLDPLDYAEKLTIVDLIVWILSICFLVWLIYDGVGEFFGICFDKNLKYPIYHCF